MKLIVAVLVLVLAGCGPDSTMQGAQGVQMDDTAATQRAEEVVAGVLDATAPDREQTPSEGSGRLGPPCEPDGPVTRSRFVGATVPLQPDDDHAGMVRAAADWFTAAGLEVDDVRTEAPQQGAYARDAAGGTYSLRILEDVGTLAASANTPCLPHAGDEGIDDGPDDLAALLAETADDIGAGVPSAAVPTGCPGGQAAQRTMDFDTADEAALAFERLEERWETLGAVVTATAPDGSWQMFLERDDVLRGAVLMPDSSSLMLVAERGCDEE